MQKLLFIVVILIVGSANAQKHISLDAVKMHIGDSVHVCAKVYGGRFVETGSGAPTYINLGAAYPEDLLTIVILGADRTKFNDRPEQSWKGRQICVSGVITEFRGKPQMIVTKTEQVSFP